ncbi:MAG: 50S ribosomal protein L4 [Lachnospiraceae bacterium]|jgi:large subunit ribosomal protein L4|nr:50S ribosomal protein L4 [Lachnospiraceae bacterium]MBQ6258959.1 50S ribosomal protein L4 [Lachnospiraceae bacterium]
MAEVKVFNTDGKEAGTLELSDSVFGVEPNEHLVALAVKQYLANQRQGTQKAKTRSEVSGGGRKPWRQKGTGHARQGSIRAPQWKGGGMVFAPVPRDYSFKMNRKEKRAALCSVLSSKVLDNKLCVIEGLSMDAPKTKDFAKVVSNLELAKAVFVIAENDESRSNIVLSARNMPNVITAAPNTINVFDLLKYDTIVLTKDAAKEIEEVYA